MKTKLPEGVLESDLKYPDYKSKTKMATRKSAYGYDESIQFEMWYTDCFGWCIPTLLIKGVGRRARNAGIVNERTYAARVSDGAVVRIGFGPHVKERVTVYVKASREKALAKYVEMFFKGQGDAAGVRDRISSRRAQSALRRSNHSFNF